MSADRLPFDELFLKEKLKSDPTTWETRRQLAQGLYDKQAFAEAAEIIWTTEQIPNTDLDLAFAIRVLAKAQPRRAIRLLTALLELNQGKAVQNMAMANALLHHGMVLQAARFYGAALEADPTLVNPDLEHFILWSDDESTMWGLFDNHRPKLGELPWMIRDPKEALRLTSRISLHTTPIYVPELPIVPGEHLKHELYQQEAKHNAKITPPPAVTIPIDRVNPKDRLYDATYGASVVRSAPEPATPAEVQPKEELTPPAAPVPVLPVAPLAPPVAAAIPAAPVLPQAPIAPAAPAAAVLPAAPVAPAAVLPAAPIAPAAVLPAAPATPVAPITPPAAASAFPAKVAFPNLTPPTSSAPNAIVKETESVAENAEQVSPTAPAQAPAKVVEPFPSMVKFPETNAPSPQVALPAINTPAEETKPAAPAAPAGKFPSKVVFPDVAEPAASAAPVNPASTPQTIAQFFADPTPSSSVAASADNAFFADPKPSGPVPLPPIQSEKKEESPPEKGSADTIKKAPIPEAFPISQSAVPTTVLRVKWSTAPARPGGSPATPPSAAPVAPPAPPVSAPIPFAAPAAAQAEAPTTVPFTQPGAPTGAPNGVFTPSSTPAGAADTGAPTRALVPPVGTAPTLAQAGAPTGAPTRALLPSAPPPTQAPAGGLRRLLFLPGRAVPPANQSDSENS